MLPLVQRELRVAARQRKLYRSRLLFGLVVVVFGGGILLFANPNHPVKSGGSFVFFSVVALILCLVEGLRKTADAISEEKRAGTLGFLFLTDLRGWDIVLGKYAGALVRSLNVLLAFVPILSVTLLAGGTTLGDFWRTVLVLAVVMCFSLALCLFISAISRERSLSVCVAVLLVLCIVPMVASKVLADGFRLAEWRWVAIFSPVALLLRGWESYYVGGPEWYWRGLAGFAVASGVFLGMGSLILPRIWQEKPRKVAVQRSKRTERSEAKRRARQLDQNPILWVAYHGGQARMFRIIFFSLVVILLGARFFMMDAGWEPEVVDLIALVILTLLLNVYIASQASMNLAEAKRSGALEMLLSTPLKVGDIIRGQILALKEMFLWPALVLAGWYLFVILNSAFSGGTWGGWGLTVMMLMHFLQLILGICAIAAVGMWMGMSSKTPNRALFKTILVGVLLPYFPCIPAFVVQLVLTAIAKDQVVRKFRRYVAERYLQAPGFVLAPVPPADPHAPPVLGGPPPLK